jgi:predicted Zn-dependent peptidase
MYGSIYLIQVTARPSDQPADVVLARLTTLVDEELDRLREAPPDARELDRVRNGIEASFVNQLENLSSKADQLNAYFMSTGNPDYFAEDLGRFQHIQPHDIQAAVRRWLPRERRVELAVVPAPRN